MSALVDFVASRRWGRRQRYSVRAFYLTLFILSCLVVYSSLADRRNGAEDLTRQHLWKRAENLSVWEENLEVCKSTNGLLYVANNCG